MGCEAMPKRVAGDAFIYLNITNGIPERFTNNTLIQMVPAMRSRIRVNAG
jgi:hypothetical protein